MPTDAFGIAGTLQAGVFRVEGPVAEGGFAVVYRAQHTAFRAPVALKCLKLHALYGAEAQATFLERFREEAELLFRLSQCIPEVVRPLQIGTLEVPSGAFVPFLAMEWLDGLTLDEKIRRRREAGKPPLSLEHAVRLLAPAAWALDRAHRLPGPDGVQVVLHRDLKPENLFLVRRGDAEVPKVLDFGIGKVKSAATQIAGKQSAVTDALNAFTPAYGAPEQWLPKHHGQTGTWTDVWGLALTVVETVLGRTPLEGDPPALMGAAIDEKRRPTPRAEGVPTSDAVDAVFLRALAVRPGDRYARIADFWRDLERALGLPSSEPAAPKAAGAPSIPPLAPLAPPTATTGKAEPIPDLEPLPAPAPRSAPRHPPPAPAAPPVHRSAPTGDRDVAALFGGKTIDDLDDDASSVPLVALAEEPRAASLPVPRSSPRAATPPPETPRAVAPLASRLAGPIRLVGLGVLVMAADLIAAAVRGEPFTVGPLRAVYVAAPLVLIGVGLAALRFFSDE